MDTPTANDVLTTTTVFAPVVMAGVQAAEQSDATGEDKRQAVIDGVNAAAEVMTGIPVPSVQAVGALIELFVTVFNKLGIFKKKPKIKKENS